MNPQTALRVIKMGHTIIWAVFAACILTIPVCAWRGEFGTSVVLIAIVSVEVIIIAANHWRCPLTDMAERYTEKRQDNFDIYLPLWLARYNKQIFGSIFVAGLLYTLSRWKDWI